MTGNEDSIFRSLTEKANRKFAKVRDLPAHGRDSYNCYFRKVFKAYTKLWKFQQENRTRLVEAGLNRWEIGEIASRIGQLYYQQYLRTSETRFLLGSFVFYEAILKREYFKDCSSEPDLVLKELRFLARFLVVCLLLNRVQLVERLIDQLKDTLEGCRKTIEDRHFKEWKRVVQEIMRFMKADAAFMNTRHLNYQENAASDLGLAHMSNFQMRKSLRLQDALLTSYRPNEVKFTELSLDTFRIMQFLEWECNESFSQVLSVEPCDNVVSGDLTAAANRVNLVADASDSTIRRSPRKAILYRPSITNLLAVIAMICQELPPDGIFLLYISAPGKANQSIASHVDNSFRHGKGDQFHGRSLRINHGFGTGTSNNNDVNHVHYHPHYRKIGGKDPIDGFLWLGPRGNGGYNNLYPDDIIPFTRRPLFLIIDSDNSYAFKAGLPSAMVSRGQASPLFPGYSLHGHSPVVIEFPRFMNSADKSDRNMPIRGTDVSLTELALHGMERGETAALILSPEKPTSIVPSEVNPTHEGSQFTFFLTSPLHAFCQLVRLPATNIDVDVFKMAENIFFSILSEWEAILCTSEILDQVWARVLCDPFLRPLIIRFVFCRSVLAFFKPSHNDSRSLPSCLPHLPDSLSPSSTIIQSSIRKLANCLEVIHHFTFSDIFTHRYPDSSFELSEIQEIG